MSEFLADDFLLQTEAAKILYNDYAASMPIYDFHSHLPALRLALDEPFENLAQAWLKGDHYKWRFMRSYGIEERFCTGDAKDYDKFLAWAGALPKAIGNPLYHWTHMELRAYFGVRGKTLSAITAKEIWEHCNAFFSRPDFTPRALLQKMNVRVLYTTDDPADSLEHHRAIAAAPGFGVRVFPTFRPDRITAAGMGKGFDGYCESLEKASGKDAASFGGLLDILDARHRYFHEAGCRISDHALDNPGYEEASKRELERIYRTARLCKGITPREAAQWRAALLLRFAEMNAKRGWAMQLHVGAVRNVNTRKYSLLGPDTGFDCMGDEDIIRPLSLFLDALDQRGKLPKTVLYPINPKDYDAFVALAGCFQDSDAPGKIQVGPAWWFNDTMDGMERHLKTLGNLGCLGGFVGMATDSRSFLSFPRHDYFRRILCNLIGGWMEKGELPQDFDGVGGIVQDICYRNAASYFGTGDAL